MPKISVIIPCYNGAEFLAETLASVAAQSHPVHEIIVVDDWSSDDSRAIADASGATVLQTPVNSGSATARNTGIQHASGDLIALLDADDIWLPRHCATMVDLLERHPSALLAFGRLEKFGTARGVSPRHPVADQPMQLLPRLLQVNPVPQSSVMVRRQVMLDAGGYDVSHRNAEDYDLWIRLSEKGRFVCTNDVTLRYRTHAGQKTATLSTQRVQGWWRMRRGHADRMATLANRPYERSAELELWDALHSDLDWAWRSGHRSFFDDTLAQAHLVPGSEPLVRIWRRRAARYWWLRTNLQRVWQRLMPDTLRTRIARLRGLTR